MRTDAIRACRVGLALALAMFVTTATATGSAPTVTIDAGTLVGIHLTKPRLDEFLGIAYAAPPCAARS